MEASNLLFVSAAYAVAWAMFIGYFVHVRRATSRARALLDSVNSGSLR
ncbi:MAG: hypothetical protein ABI442_15065 [Gemmatimonadaceae bacterium]